MVKHKSQSKKPQKGGVDFKKIKRKIGRKLPPPNNTTNTEIKSKAIVLPEQSIASEKAGLAVSKKGLTLKELLQQTSHHNAKVRKDALLGMKDILLKHPVELKLHKLAVVEKLRKRISDDDKIVRETLYQLFKSVILPGCAKDNQGSLVSLMTSCIFDAMTHLAFEVRVMAFKFFDLVVQFYPSSFSSYAEKMLGNYGDILRQNQFLEDKSKLKSILTGLIRCLSLLPCHDTSMPHCLHAFEPETANESDGFADISKKLEDLISILVGSFLDFMPMLHINLNLDLQSCDCLLLLLKSLDLIVGFLVGESCKILSDTQFLPHCQMPDTIAYDQFISPTILNKLWDVFPLQLAHHLSEKDNDRIFMVNTAITKVFLQLSNNAFSPYTPVEKFLEFIGSSLVTKMELGKVFYEKHLLPIIPYIPKLVMQISGDSRSHILEGFTEAFRNCNPESPMKFCCLTAIEEMLVPERSLNYTDANDPDRVLLHYQIAWIKEFPSLLIMLDDKNPLCSKTILRLLILVAQTFPVNSQFHVLFDSLQYSFKNFFSTEIENAICFGPFVRLDADIQELSLSCLYYFTYRDSLLLQSLVSCCLCDELDPSLVICILEVLHSVFRAGRIHLADYTSFHLTLLSRFRVYPEKFSSSVKADGKSNQLTFKYITKRVCSYMLEIGDSYLVFQMLERPIVDQICSEMPMENKCAFLRLLVTLDSNPTRLSDLSIVKISRVLPQYLIKIIFNVGDDKHESTSLTYAKRRYFLLPSFHLFHRSERLSSRVLNFMGSCVLDSNLVFGFDLPHSSVNHSTLACAISMVILHMYEDDKMRQILLTFKIEIKNILQNLINLQSSECTKLTMEERHKIQNSYDRLREIVMPILK
ncbi:uncharacterized protein LOC127264984 isoform X2 [Andrographis paniculata]|uniref:uncharacterized protein LOC127264984 isoform X2 n=1 Tax=Andrographis paniculata TaxID=175694 RepID=UPI0021E84361|nr:uncharacterized protein LOC127264984 isoform X2 [Andrographis paniculata]